MISLMMIFIGCTYVVLRDSLKYGCGHQGIKTDFELQLTMKAEGRGATKGGGQGGTALQICWHYR